MDGLRRSPLRRPLRSIRNAWVFRNLPPPHVEWGDPEFDRVYHVHVRKCGGTSTNRTVLAFLSGDPGAYDLLASRADHRLEFSGRPVVGWSRPLLERGAFWYGFSHIPFHALRLPPRTFTFTVLRDPVDRVVSHFNMTKEYLESGAPHPSLADEGRWAAGSLRSFVERAPVEHLMNQLYMFDRDMNRARALDRLRTVSRVVMLDDYPALIEHLNYRFSLELPVSHLRQGKDRAGLSQEDRGILASRLEEEYRLLEDVRREGLA